MTTALEEATAPTRGLARFITSAAQRLGPVSRRGFFVGAAMAGTAMTVDAKRYALQPVAAYATICGPGNTAASGWTVFCCTINKGVNSCPPGSFAAGWWKAADSSWCGGGYRYIVDCNASCSKCSSGCAGDHICNSGCWSCSCGRGSTASCDQRRVCCNAFRYGQCNTQISCSGGVHCRVVSCVPPYQWANCTTTSLQDNRTNEHSAPCLPVWSGIALKYRQLGEQKSYLRASTGPQRAVGDARGGKYVLYQGGAIYWSSTTGAIDIDTFLRGRWLAVTGGPTGVLGYPTQSKYSTIRGGILQTFEHGCITDSPQTSTSFVAGPFYTTWAVHSRESGVLGYPTGNRFTGARGGLLQGFQGGSIAAGPGKGAYSVLDSTNTVWNQFGRDGGALGYPLGNRFASVRGGAIQLFETGAIVDGPATPKCAVTQPAYDVWKTHSREWGLLAFPTANRRAGAGGGWVQTFEKGSISARPGGGAFASYGVMDKGWAAAGREAGVLGYPTAANVIAGRGRSQVFTKGELWSLGAGPARRVYGAVLQQWKAAGGSTGRYGFPLTETTAVGASLTCRFEGGTITA